MLIVILIWILILILIRIWRIWGVVIVMMMMEFHLLRLINGQRLCSRSASGRRIRSCLRKFLGSRWLIFRRVIRSENVLICWNGMSLAWITMLCRSSRHLTREHVSLIVSTVSQRVLLNIQPIIQNIAWFDFVLFIRERPSAVFMFRNVLRELPWFKSFHWRIQIAMEGIQLNARRVGDGHRKPLGMVHIDSRFRNTVSGAVHQCHGYANAYHKRGDDHLCGNDRVNILSTGMSLFFH